MQHDTTTAASPSASQNHSRVDLYGAVHKGLRAMLCDALVRLGAADPSQPEAWRAATDRVLAALVVCEQHLIDEEEFIERALSQRAGSTASHTREDHQHHTRAIVALRTSVASIEATAAMARAPSARALYLEFASFVADNLAHMRAEESINNAALWRLFTDVELIAVLDALVAAIPPEVERTIHEWMLPALHHGERVAMLSHMQALAPPAALAAKLEIAERTLDGCEFRALIAALARSAPTR